DLRATGVAGRHRAADEERRPEVSPGEEPWPEEAPVAEPQPEVAPAAERTDATVLMPRAEVDCLTRPLRLGDRMSRPRIPRPDGALRA
ncbi:hypothetical protein, partial [Geodermatophilus sp. DF01-2]|uniref:hypothetical protein n=1 Tax=Geodermatophilus sp. DF01-2 TaxID=2559610 RepID=UPI001ADDB125